MRKIAVFIISATLFSCNTEPANPQAWEVDYEGMVAAIEATDTVPAVDLPYPYDTLKIEDAFLNNHPLEMPIADFRKIEKPDSSHESMWGCGSQFNRDDEPLITTFYCGNKTYVSNDTSVMIDRFNMAGNTFSVPSLGLIFTDKTTLAEFGNYFPVSKMTASMPDSNNEGMVRCDVLYRYPFDDEFIFYFKNGTLREIVLYWLLC